MSNSPKSLLEVTTEEIKKQQPRFPDELIKLLTDTEGAAKLAKRLPESLPPTDVAVPHSGGQRIWEIIGSYYVHHKRYHEAALIFSRLYDHLLLYQTTEHRRCHKGVPLFWFGQCHWALENKVIAKRYIMLALCEDAIKDQGAINTKDSGSYWKLVWELGLTDEQVNNYISKAWENYNLDKVSACFPEWALQRLDQDWIVEVPNPSESSLCIISHAYAAWLLSQSHDRQGQYLEHLAQYLISAMPGCRAFRHVPTNVSEFDVVGALEGTFTDFRSELGRYLLVESKDWEKPADTTTALKFSRVLDSARCRFGLLFSRKGVTGSKNRLHAQREIADVFKQHGIVIVVITEEDLIEVTKGRNFLTMLRRKYEMVRFDLRRELGDDAPPVRKSGSKRNRKSKSG